MPRRNRTHRPPIHTHKGRGKAAFSYLFVDVNSPTKREAETEERPDMEDDDGPQAA